MVTRYNKQYGLSAEGVAKKGDTFYFVARELNLIFKLDAKNYEIKYFTAMPDEDEITERLYNGIITNGEVLLLVPFNAKKIWWYDFEKAKWEYINLAGYVEPMLEGKFVGGIIIREKAYLFGYYYEGVLLVDLKNKTIRDFLEKEPKKNCSYWGQSVAWKDDVVYVANRVKNEILKINVEDENYEIVKTPYSNDLYIGIAYDGSSFWLVPHYGSKVYRWDGGQEFHEVDLSAVFGSDVGFFNGLCVGKRYVVLYSPRGRSCIIDKLAERIEFKEESMLYAEYKPEIGFLVCREGRVSFYDEDFQLKKEIAVSINGSMYAETVGEVCLTGRKIYESRGFGLQEFLWALQEA